MLAPAAGAVLGVVGVQFDQTLPLRAGPGSGDTVANLAPLAADLVATGQAQDAGTAIWYEVASGGVTGWADAAFLGYLGTTTDATAEIVARLGGTPTAGSMLELGAIVASTVASSEDPVSRVSVVVAPTSGDLGEVTYDVVGLPDDSILGARLHVFGTPSGELPRSELVRSAGTFTLKTVESTALCRRGVTTDGLCT